MNYLFFDVECISCKGGTGKLFSFGYVLTDENFKIIEKDDIVINPDISRAEYDWYVVRKIMTYSLNEIEDKPNFASRYKEIKRLLGDSNNIVFGFDVINDILYVNDECKRYNLPKFDIKAWDVQDFYRQINGTKENKSLKKLVDEFNIDIGCFEEHNSRDDAEMTMLVAKAMCDKLAVSMSDLIKMCDKSFVQARDRKEKTDKDLFSVKLKVLANKYPDRYTWKAICLSDTIKEDSVEDRLKLIEAIFEAGYNYETKISNCSIFVTGNSYGKRDKSCDYNIRERGLDIKKISISELSKLIKKDINENGELIDYDNPFMVALMENLKKQGITYEEYKKQFNN